MQQNDVFTAAWDRMPDLQLSTITCALLTPTVVHPTWALALNALLWQLFHTVELGVLLQAQSRSKFVVRHLSEEEGNAAMTEAFDNWKVYNCSFVMTYGVSLLE